MLGNQYFMARNYLAAQPELEEALIKNSSSKGLRRKLVVCYTQTGNTQKALDLFYGLIKEDIEFIISADPVNDDCPCPELLERIETRKSYNDASIEELVNLGIIWLFCNPENSISHFEAALKMKPESSVFLSIINLIKNYLEVHPH